MNRICYELQSYDMWLGLPVRAYFDTIKQAKQYHKVYCIGTGLIAKVRLKAEGKYYTSCQPANPEVEYLPVNHKTK